MLLVHEYEFHRVVEVNWKSYLSQKLVKTNITSETWQPWSDKKKQLHFTSLPSSPTSTSQTFCLEDLIKIVMWKSDIDVFCDDENLVKKFLSRDESIPLALNCNTSWENINQISANWSSRVMLNSPRYFVELLKFISPQGSCQWPPCHAPNPGEWRI